MRKERVLSTKCKIKLRDIFSTTYFPKPYNKYILEVIDAVEDQEVDVSKAFFTNVRDAILEMRGRDIIELDIAGCALCADVQFYLYSLPDKYKLIDTEDAVRDRYVRMKDEYVKGEAIPLRFEEGNEDELIEYINSLDSNRIYKSNGTSKELLSLLLLVRPEIKLECSVSIVFDYIKSVYIDYYKNHKSWYVDFNDTIFPIEEDSDGTYTLPGERYSISRSTFLGKYKQVPKDYIDKGVECEEVVDKLSQIIWDSLELLRVTSITFYDYVKGE